MSVLLSRTGSAGRNHRDCHGDAITVTVTVRRSHLSRAWGAEPVHYGPARLLCITVRESHQLC